MSEHTTQLSVGRRIGRSVLWILSTALITFVLIILIGGLLWAAFLGFEELNRSFSAITARNEANEQRIALLRSDVDNLLVDSRRIGSLQSDVDDLEARQARFQERVTADLNRQQEVLAVLEEDVAVALNDTTALAEDMAALGTALSALQGDINENGRRIDELGGEMDRLRTEVSTVDAELTDLQAVLAARAEDEMSELQQTLALFRVWELISRARLRLLEDNLGLAQADLEQARQTMDLLVAAVPEEDAEVLQRVQTRLELASINLPGNPAMAASDLEGAWDALDEVLTAMLLPELETVESLSEETASSAAGEEATAEPAPTAATPTPALTATPEAMPTPTATVLPSPTP
ncbi:MAG TPA: hypothetical protein VF177_05560 [Anaerolineae bacterium]